MRNSLILVTGSLLFTCGALPSLAQTTAPFTLSVQQAQSITPISNGQTLGVTSPAVGQATTFTISGTYTGTTTAIFSSEAQLIGSPDFSAAHLSPAIPATLSPGASFNLALTYKPSSTAVASAQLTLPFTISPATSTGTPASGVLVFNLSGAAASLSVNYFSAPSNNIIPLSSGGTIPFPSTLVNTTSVVTVIIANLGAASGSISSVTIAGTNNAFQLQGVGLLPTGVSSGGSFSFNVLYTPSVVGSDTGTLTIQFPSGPFVVNLTGTSTSANLTYQVINGGVTTPITVGQPITLPDTNVGAISSVTINVQNTGSAPSTIANISTTGTAYGLSDVPVLPAVIPANSSLSFTLNFAPPTPSVLTGTLTIGGTRFNLTGKGLGQLLTYSYSSTSGASTPVAAGGTILFPSTPLAQTATQSVTVTNSGTLPTTITSINVASTSPSVSFSVSQLPSLPVNLVPGASFIFSVNFTPTAAGLNTATLLINTTAITLSGFAAGGPTFPSYQFTGVSGQVQPLTQPSVGLSLSQGYPLDVAGVLTLSVSSNVFVADPAVQFATGGRTIAFTIPANTTTAIFANGAQTVPFQTGTVAENITFSASFTTVGGVAISSPNSSTLTVTVPQLAPTLLSVQITSVSSSSITVLVEGYSTTRSLTKFNFQFKSLSPNFALNPASFSLDASQGSGFWYASSASSNFGSEFAVTYPFTITLPSGTTAPILTNNVSVSVTAANSIGTSNSVSSQ